MLYSIKKCSLNLGATSLLSIRLIYISYTLGENLNIVSLIGILFAIIIFRDLQIKVIIKLSRFIIIFSID